MLLELLETSASSTTEPVSFDVVMQAIEQLKKMGSRPRFFFSKFVDPLVILHGEFVDKMLQCEDGGKGYLAGMEVFRIMKEHSLLFEDVTHTLFSRRGI